MFPEHFDCSDDCLRAQVCLVWAITWTAAHDEPRDAAPRQAELWEGVAG